MATAGMRRSAGTVHTYLSTWTCQICRTPAPPPQLAPREPRSVPIEVYQEPVFGGQGGSYGWFPCVVESAKWGGAVAVALRGVEQRWIGEIEKLQPCSPSYSAEPNSHPLALLDNANNLCKHRLLPAVLMNAAYADHQISAMIPGGKMDFFFNDVPPADGEDHFRFTFEQPTNVTVVVDPNPVWRVNFPDLPSDPDWENMDLVNWVEGAIAVFEAAFK